MRQISALPLAESARRSLDTELRNARGAAGRLEVLKRWFTALGRTEAIFAGYAARAEQRTLWVREEPLHSIAPWLKR